MRKLLAALGAFLLAACATTQQAAAPPQPRPAMWKLADEDTTIYLFGTIHLLPEGHQWRTQLMDRALAEATELVLEVQMPDDPSAMMTAMAKLAASPGLPPLAERVPADKRDELQRIVAQAGLPPAMLDRLETWAAAMLLMASSMRQMGLDPNLGVESRLTAAHAGKRVRGLETVEEQLGFFDQLPEEAQRAMLVSTLDDPAEARAELNAMLEAWRRGDVDAVARTFNAETAFSPVVREALLTRRNARWAEWLARRLEQPGTVFVAVGAGHLAGDDSVQEMLERRGLKATRVQ